MPTRTGLLKAGDHLRHPALPVDLIVVRRNGNDINYSVDLRRADGERFPLSLGGRYIMTLIEVDWKLKHPSTSHLELVKP